MKGGMSVEDIMHNFIEESCEFNSMRYPDFTEYKNHLLPLLHYMMPSIDSKVVKAN